MVQSRESPPQTPNIETKKQPDGSIQYQRDATPDAKPTKNRAPGMNEVISETPKNKSRNETRDGDEQGTEFYTAFGLKLKVTDTLLVIFTGGLFVATFFLWLSTRDLVKGAEETSERQLRAYISVDKASVVIVGRTFQATVDLKNSGQTPAYDMTTQSRLITYPPREKLIIPPSEEVELSKGILGPGGILSAESKLVIPPENTELFPALQNGSAVIYVVGRTEYRDVFGKPRYLDFRLRSSRVEGDRWILGPTPDGDKAD